MKTWKDNVKNEINRIWPKAQKNVAKINKDVGKLLKKSEENLVHLSKNVQKGVEKVVFKARREELYYELGKAVASSLTSDQLKNKNVLRISTELHRLNRNLRSKK